MRSARGGPAGPGGPRAVVVPRVNAQDSGRRVGTEQLFSARARGGRRRGCRASDLLGSGSGRPGWRERQVRSGGGEGPSRCASRVLRPWGRPALAAQEPGHAGGATSALAGGFRASLALGWGRRTGLREATALPGSSRCRSEKAAGPWVSVRLGRSLRSCHSPTADQI